ncbi:MAG: phosphoribosylanthranilate isomerase [Pseudomonadota bacterium]
MPTRVRVKICGITRLEDAQAAVAAGADALGFVLYPPSPRAIAPESAAAIIRALPPFVTPVALFVDPSVEAVRALLALAPNVLLQFHGDESDAFCAQFGRPWIKALAVKAGSDAAAAIAAHPGASGILLDAWHPDLRGGTGESFDWTCFPRGAGKPLILAGGLTPANVAGAVRLTRPYAVDVSGGVEALAADGSVQKGIKDAGLVEAFIAAAHAGVENA